MDLTHMKAPASHLSFPPPPPSQMTFPAYMGVATPSTPFSSMTSSLGSSSFERSPFAIEEILGLSHHKAAPSLQDEPNSGAAFAQMTSSSPQRGFGFTHGSAAASMLSAVAAARSYLPPAAGHPLPPPPPTSGALVPRHNLRLPSSPVSRASGYSHAPPHPYNMTWRTANFMQLMSGSAGAHGRSAAALLSHLTLSGSNTGAQSYADSNSGWCPFLSNFYPLDPHHNVHVHVILFDMKKHCIFFSDLFNICLVLFTTRAFTSKNSTVMHFLKDR